MNDLKTIYDDMWNKFTRTMTYGEYELDEWINNPHDTRRGITALAYLKSNNKVVSSEISRLSDHLKQLVPNQYYQPESELHLTILSIISCITGFTLDEIDPKEYVEIFNQSVFGIEPIEILFKGVTASPSCILIQGFPVGEGLNQVRENLRKNFKQSGLRSSIDSRYKISTAHITAVRFSSPITDTGLLISLCKKYKDHMFGSALLTDFDLVFNDWYQRKCVTELLGHHSIK